MVTPRADRPPPPHGSDLLKRNRVAKALSRELIKQATSAVARAKAIIGNIRKG